jgi:hypothetical protein
MIEEPGATLVVNEEVEAETELIEPTDGVDVLEVSNKGTEPEKTPTAGILPTPRSELESTDPASVNLASGNIQLIELFAFW